MDLADSPVKGSQSHDHSHWYNLALTLGLFVELLMENVIPRKPVPSAKKVGCNPQVTISDTLTNRPPSGEEAANQRRGRRGWTTLLRR